MWKNEFIYDENFKDRIDVFLNSYFGYSRNFFHHIIERKWVLVNNKPVKKSYKLKCNDKIKVDNLERYLDSSFLEELPYIDIGIVLEKEDYLVLNKPKWVLSHPNSIWDLSAPSVVAFLYQKYKNLPSIWNFIRAWLVHRLDKDTNWLMIVAKTEKGLNYFKNLFQQKSTLENVEEKEKIPLQKFYKAEVNITQKWKEFLESIKLPFYIKEIVKPKVPYPWTYKLWITKIIDLRQNILYLQLLTWRTHQIRYHLMKKWLPIIWDKLYWNKENQSMMALTAYRLKFKDLYWENIDLSL